MAAGPGARRVGAGALGVQRALERRRLWTLSINPDTSFVSGWQDQHPRRQNASSCLGPCRPQRLLFCFPHHTPRK